MPLPRGIVALPGQFLICDFGPDPSKVQPPGLMRGPLGVPPEIYKERPAVAISSSSGLTTIVPLSTVAPRSPQRFHVRLNAGRYAILDPDTDSWVKADLLTSVSNLRLDRPFLAGQRTTTRLTAEDLSAVRKAVLHALGLSRLTEHL